MDKISGILPATARVTTVDLRNSGSVRAGSPSWGREVGVTAAAAREAALALEKQNTLTTAGRANGALQEQLSQRVDPKAEIVKKMADGFFVNRNAQVTAPVQIQHDELSDMVIDPKKFSLINESKGESKTESSEGISKVDLKASPAEDGYLESAELPPEESYLATGQHLDVRA